MTASNHPKTKRTAAGLALDSGVDRKARAARHTVLRRPLPPDLAEVALLDIRDVCAAVRMSASWWHDEVRAGRAPQPLRYGPRCSRWRSADIRRYLIERAEKGTGDSEAARLTVARAKNASAAAQAKRAAKPESPGQERAQS